VKFTKWTLFGEIVFLCQSRNRFIPYTINIFNYCIHEKHTRPYRNEMNQS